MDDQDSEDKRNGYVTTEEDRRRVIEQARRELPALDRQYAEATKRLHEILGDWTGARRANR